jgi:hypothetical protein
MVTPTGCTLCTVRCTSVHSQSPRWFQQAQVALSLFRHLREIYVLFLSVLYTGKLSPPFLAKIHSGVAPFKRSPEGGDQGFWSGPLQLKILSKNLNSSWPRRCRCSTLLQQQNFLSPLTLLTLISVPLCSKSQAPIGGPLDFSLAN